MKISPSDRVEYTKNPLAEVICQVQFQRTSIFDNGLPEALANYLKQNEFVVVSEEQTFSIALALVSGSPETHGTPQQIPTGKVFHFATEDGSWKASVCANFLAITCTKYRNWADFYPRLVNLSEKVFSIVGETSALRIGLRYKDIIERESLGLDGVPWHDLIAPFLLGPLSLNSLSDDEVIDDSSFGNFLSQSTIRLEDCSLLLQSVMLTSVDNSRRAFLIDSDFYIDAKDSASLYQSQSELTQKLEALHNNAGSLFRRSITEKLHVALGPKPI